MSDFNPNLSTRTVLMEKYKEKLESRFRFPKFEFFEPIVQNRFCVYFPDIFEMESFLIQKITAPKLRLINNNYQWNDITISFVDNVGRSISDKLLKIIEFCKIQKGIHQIDKILVVNIFNNVGFGVTEFNQVLLRQVDPSCLRILFYVP